MDIEECRRRIDAIDENLVKLLNERAAVALQICNLKRANGLPVYAPDREAVILRRIAEVNSGPLSREAVNSIYREIISCIRALEKVIRVAYLGPAGTFTHQAARGHFGGAVEYTAQETIEEVFAAVSMERADVGVVPIENSTGGGVVETLDMFLKFDLKICAEIMLDIHHNVLGHGKLEDVKRVCSKPEAIAQCRLWLSENLPRVELMPVASTTSAAEAVKTSPGTAAIASREAAEIYGLEVLAENIEDQHDNATRFVVLARKCGARTGKDKTSVMFAIKNEVGALYHMLLPFRAHNINLTKIESRPSRTKAWDYTFFVDFEGHQDEAEAKLALQDLETRCRFLQVLGSYPRADVRG